MKKKTSLYPVYRIFLLNYIINAKVLAWNSFQWMLVLILLKWRNQVELTSLGKIVANSSSNKRVCGGKARTSSPGEGSRLQAKNLRNQRTYLGFSVWWDLTGNQAILLSFIYFLCVWCCVLNPFQSLCHLILWGNLCGFYF